MAINRPSKKQNRIITAEATKEETMASNLTYTASSDGGAQRRFRTPSPHDVLSGRGGSVNSHPGNHQFREWVKVRREDYSLAFSKDEKAIICREVIALVERLGGRFLVKESPSSQWWIELDDERVMAKTSQALREGAPQIRASHQEEIAEMMEARQQRSRKTNKKRNFTQASQSSAPRVTAEKRSRFENDTSFVLPSAEDATVHSTSSPDDNELMPAPNAVPSMPFPTQFSPKKPLKRQNSLALSEFGDMSMDIEFVNPFADESELLGRLDDAPVVPRGSLSVVMVPPKPAPLWRQSSNSSIASDMGGLGALFRSTDSKSNASVGSLPSLGSFIRESSFNSVGASNAPIESVGSRSMTNNMRSRYADSKDDDALSIASDSTLDLPLWEWFNRDELASSQQIPVSF